MSTGSSAARRAACRSERTPPTSPVGLFVQLAVDRATDAELTVVSEDGRLVIVTVTTGDGGRLRLTGDRTHLHQLVIELDRQLSRLGRQQLPSEISRR